MWNEPSKERLSKIPRLYETEDVPLWDKRIHLHFFVASCDWYIAEFDGEDLFWGFAHLGDDQCAEWGYISLSELKSIKMDGWLEIDCELEENWKVCKASNIEKICKAQRWPEDIGSPGNYSREDKLIRKIRAGHFQFFQDLLAEVTSPESDFFGIDPYPEWNKANRVEGKGGVIKG